MTAFASLAGLVAEDAVGQAGGERWAALGTPEAVVRPGDAEEAAAILAWASREGVGVVPAGSGRRLGPRGVRAPFMVMTTDRLVGVEIYEPADLTFTAGAGTRVGQLATELRAHRQWLPFDPPNVAERTLAGLVAAGESGPLRTGYGSLRNHVLGMTVVTGDGRVLHLGGRVVKNVAGFDLLKPMVGGRGRLGFITSICLRAFPEPEVDVVVVKKEASLSALAPLALAVATAPVMPASCVLAAGEVTPDGDPLLAVRLHGSAATVDADRLTLESHLGIALEVSTAGPAVVDADRLAEPDTLLSASVRPSRLVEALAGLDALAPTAVRIDAYAARLSVGVARWPAEAARAWRDRLHALGGALSVMRAPPGADSAAVASRGTDDERRLASRVASVFDPEGVFWRETR